MNVNIPIDAGWIAERIGNNDRDIVVLDDDFLVDKGQIVRIVGRIFECPGKKVNLLLFPFFQFLYQSICIVNGADPYQQRKPKNGPFDIPFVLVKIQGGKILKLALHLTIVRPDILITKNGTLKYLERNLFSFT